MNNDLEMGTDDLTPVDLLRGQVSELVTAVNGLVVRQMRFRSALVDLLDCLDEWLRELSSEWDVEHQAVSSDRHPIYEWILFSEWSRVRVYGSSLSEAIAAERVLVEPAVVAGPGIPAQPGLRRVISRILGARSTAGATRGELPYESVVVEWASGGRSVIDAVRGEEVCPAHVRGG